MKPKVYVETTVISYLAARPSRDIVTAGHQRTTAEWWDRRRSSFELFISELVVSEVAQGDAGAIQRRQEIMAGMPLLEINSRVGALARALISDQALPERAYADAAHIATAAVHGIEFLMTWNLKHLANALTRQEIERVCRANGYEPPAICTPEELLEE